MKTAAQSFVCAAVFLSIEIDRLRLDWLTYRMMAVLLLNHNAENL